MRLPQFHCALMKTVCVIIDTPPWRHSCEKRIPWPKHVDAVLGRLSRKLCFSWTFVACSSAWFRVCFGRFVPCVSSPFFSGVPFVQFYSGLSGLLSVIFDRPRTHRPNGALDPEQAPKTPSTTRPGRRSKLNQVGQWIRDFMNRTNRAIEHHVDLIDVFADQPLNLDL